MLSTRNRGKAPQIDPTLLTVFTLIVLAASGGSARAAGPSTITIDRMSTQNFGNYFDYAGTARNGIPVLGEPGTYYQHDGATWISGAGSFGGSAYETAVNVSVVGSTIQYTLGNPTTPHFMSYTDYDNGNASSKGTLDPYGNPLILTATIGSTTATLSGYLLVADNPLSNYTDSRYHYYSAPVGSIVPFTVTYELSGATWQTNTFNTTFQARPHGMIYFNQFIAAPEPTSLAIVVIGAGALLLRRRPMRSA